LPEVEQFATALQIKAVNTEQRLIEGYAAAFGNRDRTNDIIEPHAFDRTLGEHRDVLVFLGHNATGLPLGEPVEIRADDKGLFTRTKIYPTTQGDDLLQVAKARMSAGKSLGMSIGFRTRQHKSGARTKEGPTRHLLDIDLVEYSFLASPELAANPLAVTTSVKRNSYRRKPMKVLERDGKWHLEEEDGKLLGSFSSEGDALAALAMLDEQKAEWTAAYINSLPDSAFAYVESGGHKDEEGKTVPRALRHYPHHNADGSLDLPHLRNALARAAANPSTGDKALPHLERHAQAAGVGQGAKDHDDAHDEQWQEGAIAPGLLLQDIKLRSLMEDIVKEQIAMGELSIDTKAGRRISNEKLSRLKEIIAHLQEVVDWGESVDLGEDGKAQVDWYRTQADLFELQLTEVA